MAKIKNCNKVIDTSGLSMHDGHLLIKQCLVQAMKDIADLQKRVVKIEKEYSVRKIK